MSATSIGLRTSNPSVGFFISSKHTCFSRNAFRSALMSCSKVPAYFDRNPSRDTNYAVSENRFSHPLAVLVTIIPNN